MASNLLPSTMFMQSQQQILTPLIYIILYHFLVIRQIMMHQIYEVGIVLYDSTWPWLAKWLERGHVKHQIEH